MNASRVKKVQTQTSPSSRDDSQVTKLVTKIPRPLKPRPAQTGIPRKRTYQPALLPHDKKDEAPPLMRMLYKKMHEEGMEPPQLARILGISHSYLRSLLNENRATNGPRGLDSATIRRAADFLEMPVVTAYVLAGILAPEDFFYKPTLADSVEAAYHDMENNGLWAAFAPSKRTWAKLPKHVKLTIAVLYEQVANKSFLETAVVPLDYAEASKNDDR